METRAAAAPWPGRFRFPEGGPVLLGIAIAIGIAVEFDTDTDSDTDSDRGETPSGPEDRWSGYDFPYLEPYEWEFGDDVPDGKVKLDVFIDGYSTDTVTVSLENDYGYDWTPFLFPLPDRPDVFRPDGLPISFRQIPAASMIERMEDITDAILFNVSGPDENQDGAVDVSDVLRVLKEGYP